MYLSLFNCVSPASQLLELLFQMTHIKKYSSYEILMFACLKRMPKMLQHQKAGLFSLLVVEPCTREKTQESRTWRMYTDSGIGVSDEIAAGVSQNLP